MVKFGRASKVKINRRAQVAPPVWAEEFEALDMTTSGHVGRWRPNAFWQDVNRGYEDFAGTSWNLNPNEIIDGSPKTAFSVASSVLTISTIRTPATWQTDIAASMAAQGQSGSVPAWSGGILITNRDVKKFLYGYFEIRARWPNPGKGMFPALWFYATDGGGDPKNKGGAEIDLFEIFGFQNGQPWDITLHYRDNNNVSVRPSIHVTAQTQNNDTTNWHTYALDWQPAYLRFYKDSVMVAEITGEDASWFDTTMDVRLNYSLDATWFPADRMSDVTTPDPLLMEIDYVRQWTTKP